MIENRYTRKSILQLAPRRKWRGYQVMLFMSMVSSGLLFLVLMAVFAFQRYSVSNARFTLQMPKMFILSTLLLVGSTYTLVRARKYLRQDRLKTSVLWLFITLGLVTLFAGAQTAGWWEFYRGGAAVPTENVASLYIYVLSGLHFAHILAAVAFLLYFTVPAYRKSRDVVDELILVTNPYQKQKLDTLLVFWHYVDGLWLVLFFYFLLTSS